MLCKPAAIEILTILSSFNGEELRGEIFQAACGDPQRELSDEELVAADKIEAVIARLSIESDETFALIEENLDKQFGICDLCDNKAPVQRVRDISQIDIDYCALGCDVHN